MSLTLKNISKTYYSHKEAVKVLEHIDLTIEPGSFVSIIGPSGCGKSTLCNLIAGIELPDEGTIFLNDQLINGKSGHVGYMLQKDLLLPWRTLLENVALGMDIKNISKAESRRKALRWLKEFGLEEFANHFPDQLSGGMRQRGALLRTILFDESTLLLDEPFGALDALTRREMQLWLLSIWEKLKNTIILITHDIEEAILLSDQVIVLSPRPARIMGQIAIPFPRPRSEDILLTDESLKLKREFISYLRKGPQI